MRVTPKNRTRAERFPFNVSPNERPMDSLDPASFSKGRLNVNVNILPQSWTPALHASLRIVTALLFLEHGTAKILGLPPLPAGSTSGPMVIGTGLAELIGGVLILVGFLTRPTAFILSGYMAVAYFMAHAP